MAKRRYGIFGGTFDPIHCGHLIAAQTSLEELQLDRVVFLPSAHPPHKNAPVVSPYDIRRRMVELAIQDNPLFEISDIEAQRPDLSYTFKTLEDLRKEYPPDQYDLILLIGADSLVDFGNWKNPEEIISKITVAVFARPGYDMSTAPAVFRETVHWVRMPLIEISSTDIRKRIASNRSIRYLVPSAVETYISEQGIYKKPSVPKTTNWH
jgi:nicotinate-nucleotide adenylyltransferase